jgi:hypothetical protein
MEDTGAATATETMYLLTHALAPIVQADIDLPVGFKGLPHTLAVFRGPAWVLTLRDLKRLQLLKHLYIDIACGATVFNMTAENDTRCLRVKELRKGVALTEVATVVSHSGEWAIASTIAHDTRRKLLINKRGRQ